MRKFKDEMGKRYGRLLVLSRVKNMGTSAAWLCLCDCGKTVTVRGGSLRSGNVKSCGCLKLELIKESSLNCIDETGNRYGRLLVLSRDETIGSGASWICQCDCGKQSVVPGDRLRRGITKSCGCLRIEMAKKGNRRLPKGQTSFNRLVDSIEAAARKRNLKFDLTKEEVKELTSSPCFYCGVLPFRVFHAKRANGGYLYNGLDRVDNDKGYVENNVVSCCFECNRAKGAGSAKEFLEWVDRVYRYQHSDK